MNSAVEGDSEAQNCLGYCYYHGFGCQKNYAEALEYWQKASNQNNRRAFYNLGAYYIKQKQKDKDLTVTFFEKSAVMGYSKAITALGHLYQYGIFVEEDIQKAVKYYERAVNLGEPRAMVNIGKLYMNGIAVKKDRKKAFGFYKQAAEMKHPIGLLMMGNCIENGLGTEKDLNKSIAYY